jgi:uncharacterized protein
MNPVVHFEMPGEDMERMKSFYKKSFGWEMRQLGPDMGDYVVVQTGETDEKGMLKETNRINGGFYKKMEDPRMNAPSVVIAVNSLDESMKKVTEAGGEVMSEPMDIPGIGKYIAVKDTEGNRVGVLQPGERM